MFKKVLKLIVFCSLVLGFTWADDFLAKITNGMLSDNSKGVKVLNFNEMKEIKAGAFYHKIYQFDTPRYKFWLSSDAMYITTDFKGAIQSNTGTNSVRKKNGLSR